MPAMEREVRKSFQVPMLRCPHHRSVLRPTPGKKQKDDSIMLGVPELIAKCLNGQWRIPLGAIIDQHIGSPILCDALPQQSSYRAPLASLQPHRTTLAVSAISER